MKRDFVLLSMVLASFLLMNSWVYAETLQKVTLNAGGQHLLHEPL